jgi:predicted porin
MQKKIIALAVAGLVSGAAFAQSNVTVYGVVDAGYVYATSNAAATAATKFSGIKAGNDWGSRLGFKGEEDLGSGLKAVFNLEFGSLNNDQTTVGTSASSIGNGIAQTRNSVVGLSSATLGTILVGRQQSPAELWAAATRPMGTTADVQGIGRLSIGMDIQAYNDRLDNSVQYISPNFSGFQGKLAYSYQGEDQTEVVTAGTGRDTYGIWIAGLNYANGPIDAGFVYRAVEKNDAAALTANNKKNEWGIRGNYDFKVVKVGLAYTAQDVKGTERSKYRDGDVWTAFATAPVGANGLAMIEYGQAGADHGTAAGDVGAKAWALGYKHNLSKRTHLYAWYGEVKADKGEGFNNNGIVDIGANEKSKALVAGIKHSF